jgi:hypothetical protein
MVAARMVLRAMVENFMLRNIWRTLNLRVDQAVDIVVGMALMCVDAECVVL